MSSFSKVLKSKSRLREYIVILITTFLTMLICTESSPLYPMNMWVDPNAYITMGKSMLNGLVLYRDVFDHKGPILHFIHAVAWKLTPDSFIGVWVFEIIACYCFLLLAYRTIELFIGREGLVLIPILAIIVYSSDAMYIGDSVEELCLPIIMYAVHVIVKAMKENTYIGRSQLFILGITSGIVLWMKYTLLGFYIGWAIIPIIYIVKSKAWKRLLNMVIYVGSGVLLVTLGVLSYFIYNGALGSLFEVYFYRNMTAYGSDVGVLSFFPKVGMSAMLNFFMWGTIILGIIFLARKADRLIFKQVVLMLAVGLVAIFIKGSWYRYYTLIFGVFCPFGMVSLYHIFERPRELVAKRFKGNEGVVQRIPLLVSMLLVIPACYLFSFNSDRLSLEKSDLPQYQFAEVINQSENPTLLNFGFLDGGFYTASGVVPNCRYFCVMNLDKEEAIKAQIGYIEEGLVDYIVTTGEFEFDNYVKCMSSKSPVSDSEFFLYKKR